MATAQSARQPCTLTHRPERHTKIGQQMIGAHETHSHPQPHPQAAGPEDGQISLYTHLAVCDASSKRISFRDNDSQHAHTHRVQGDMQQHGDRRHAYRCSPTGSD
mmetsp:Transcript_41807/g.118554  ORF Transcript_41807/g.118554 Transcript_41807/m.118554 type:complete len:105 (-) Transcript_41807:699-1013(-)